MSIIKVVLCSTQNTNIVLDPKRVNFLWSSDAIQEALKQLNSLKIPILDGAPEARKKNNLFLPNQKKKPSIVGEIVSAEYRKEENQDQVIASLVINRKEEYDKIMKDKDNLCFFPLVGTSENSFANTKTEDQKEEIKYLYRQFRIVGCYPGTKRSSSNVFLKILN